MKYAWSSMRLFLLMSIVAPCLSFPLRALGCQRCKNDSSLGDDEVELEFHVVDARHQVLGVLGIA